jgi:OOP family OmpA-OmpF porin
MKKWIVALALGLVASSASHAQDIGGARDFDGIPRFQGSKIIGYQSLPYDAFRLPTGPVKEDDKFEWQMPEALDLEGKITGYVYMLPPGKSTLEVFRNYQGALTKAGFETLFNAKARRHAATTRCWCRRSTLTATSCRMADYAARRRW